LTIDHDVSDPMAITGLSMAAQAQPVTDPTEVAKAMNVLVTRYPEYAAFPMPKPEEIAVYRVPPKVISCSQSGPSGAFSTSLASCGLIQAGGEVGSTFRRVAVVSIGFT
jgi:hypothetical protein